MEEKDIKSVVGITLLVRKTNLARPKWNSNSQCWKSYIYFKNKKSCDVDGNFDTKTPWLIYAKCLLWTFTWPKMVTYWFLGTSLYDWKFLDVHLMTQVRINLEIRVGIWRMLCEWNPNPFSDQNLWFFPTMFQPWTVLMQ